jgi:hypothetical protein
MKWQIITPSKVPVEVEAENDSYLQGLKQRGYQVIPKMNVCVACE